MNQDNCNYDFRNLAEGLIAASTRRSGITFIRDEEDRFIPYCDIYTDALKMLKYLQDNGVQPRDELVIQIEDTLGFILTLWACILGNIIPVPISSGKTEEHHHKLLQIYSILERPRFISNEVQLSSIKKHLGKCGLHTQLVEIESKYILHDENKMMELAAGIPYPSDRGDMALVQFSSGSTGNPKGIRLTHDNVLTNVHSLKEYMMIGESDAMLSWLPLTHDMGLFAFHINAVMAGINQYIMSPGLFLRRPHLWLSKASQYKTTLSFTPNFGMHYFLKNSNPEKLSNIDLSNLRAIFNGAEPISVSLCERFLVEMQKYSLHQNVILPSYGLAEATVGVCGSPIGEKFITHKLHRNSLNIGQTVRPPDESCPASFVAFADVGRPFRGISIRICDDVGCVCGENIVGHIQVAGKNVANTHYSNNTCSMKIVENGQWLETGDIGFITNSRLVIVGRKKDIIFSYGQNYYPADIERVAEEVDGLQHGKVAALGIFNEMLQKDEILIFASIKGSAVEFNQIASNVREHLRSAMGLNIRHVIRENDIPRTTSGKLQRYKLKEWYEAGKYTEKTSGE